MESWPGVKFMDMPLHDFSDPQFRQEFKKEFPRTAKRIESYDQIASQVSSRREVQLGMRYKNINRETMLTLGARMEARDGPAIKVESGREERICSERSVSRDQRS